MLKVAGGIILAIVILAVVVPVACSMCAVGAVVAVNEQEKAEQAERVQAEKASSPIGAVVVYQGTCNVRAAPRPRARRIGRARADIPYAVLEVKGKWRKITVGFKTGWAGCVDVR